MHSRASPGGCQVKAQAGGAQAGGLAAAGAVVEGGAGAGTPGGEVGAEAPAALAGVADFLAARTAFQAREAMVGSAAAQVTAGSAQAKAGVEVEVAAADVAVVRVGRVGSRSRCRGSRCCMMLKKSRARRHLAARTRQAGTRRRKWALNSTTADRPTDSGKKSVSSCQ